MLSPTNSMESGKWTIKEISEIAGAEPVDVYRENKWWVLVFEHYGSRRVSKDSDRIRLREGDDGIRTTVVDIRVKIKNF